MSSPVLRPDADAVLGEEYEAFKDEVTRTVAGKLAVSKIRFAEIDMDGFYNQAWYGLYTKLQDGQQIENRKGLLVQMTYRRAIDEYRTLHPERHADEVVLEAVGVEDPIEETLDQQREFKQFVEAMRSGLTQRELTAATLCYVYGLSRPEAAAQVGVRPKRMEKIMDEVSRKLRPMLASIKEGTWCEGRALLINQFALGALDPESDEYREAVEHLDGCPGCRRHVLGTRGLTAVTIPSVLFLVALTGAAAGAAATGAAAAGSAATGSGSSAAGGGAAGGAGMGAAAQATAIAAAVAAVAVGGFVVAKNVSSGGSGSGTAATPAAKTAAATAGAGAAKAKAKASRHKAKAKARHKKARAKAAVVAPAPQPTPQPQPAPAQSTQTNPSSDSGAEFDLQ